MSIIDKLHDRIKWYPWLCRVTEAILSGEINSRLPLQKDNGKELSIILNGPSLNMSLKYLDPNNTDIMMVNHAIELELYEKLKPIYVCFVDPNLFVPSKNNYKLYKRIAEINKKTILFYPSTNKNVIMIKGREMNIRSVFATEQIVGMDAYSPKLLEQNLISPYFINVGIMALYVGIQLGYKRIVLYGADLSMFKALSVNEKLEIEQGSNHFYNDQKLNLTRIFRRGYDMTYEMRTWYETFSQFKLLSKYAEYENVKILNMSKESMLDCFEKCSG